MIGRYERPIPAASPERQRRLDLSASESENLSLREIRCPRCNYLIIKVYSDSIGHIRPKCPKCKAEDTLNLAYFRRQKGITTYNRASGDDLRSRLPSTVQSRNQWDNHTHFDSTFTVLFCCPLRFVR